MFHFHSFTFLKRALSLRESLNVASLKRVRYFRGQKKAIQSRMGFKSLEKHKRCFRKLRTSLNDSLIFINKNSIKFPHKILCKSFEKLRKRKRKFACLIKFDEVLWNISGGLIGKKLFSLILF